MQICAETDEQQQVKNLDFIFRVCIPLYFLSDMKKKTKQDKVQIDTISQILASAQYQCLLNERLKNNGTVDKVVLQ